MESYFQNYVLTNKKSTIGNKKYKENKWGVLSKHGSVNRKCHLL